MPQRTWRAKGVRSSHYLPAWYMRLTYCKSLGLQSLGGKDSSKRENFKAVWRKVKPEILPDEVSKLCVGLLIRLIASRACHFLWTIQCSTPNLSSRIRKEKETVTRYSIPRPAFSSGLTIHGQLRPPMSERRSSRNGIIPLEEDIRRLFQECKIGRGNAQLLNEALAFATPEDLKVKEIIKVRICYSLTWIRANFLYLARHRNSTQSAGLRKISSKHRYLGHQPVPNIHACASAKLWVPRL